MGHDQGVTVQIRKSTAAEGREEGATLSTSGCIEERNGAGHTLPSLGIPFLLGVH